MRLSVPLQRIVSSMLFIVYVTFTVLSGALVKCQEADGTVSIEWRGAGCCVPKALGDAGPAGVSAASSEQSGEQCGDCEDQSLGDTYSATRAHRAEAASVKAPDVPVPPSAVLVVARTVFFQSPEHWARQMRAPHPPPQLPALRTTVLIV